MPSVVEALEIISFSNLFASLSHTMNSFGSLTRLECLVLRCRLSHDAFIASFPRTVAQMTHCGRGKWSVSGHCMKPNYKWLSMCLRVDADPFFFMLVVLPLNNGVFWVVTPCGSCKNRRTLRRNSSQRTSVASCSLCCS
jgi:hypothetical protein